jgi:hypothetical protein
MSFAEQRSLLDSRLPSREHQPFLGTASDWTGLTRDHSSREIVNNALQQVKDDRTYLKIHRSWFGADPLMIP